MSRSFRHMTTLMKVGFAVACVALAVLWPEWRVALRDSGYPCEEGRHRDEFGYCVSSGADTPPSNEYLKEGQIWVYRGNGLWVAECVEPIGECKGDTYEVEVGGTPVDVGSTSVEVTAGSSGEPVPQPPAMEPQPPALEPQPTPCVGFSDPLRLQTCEYFVYMRRFASPEVFGGGFGGDNRQATTALDATSRVSGSFRLGSDGRGTLFSVCSDPTTFTGAAGTSMAIASPEATLINGNSLVDGTPFIIFSTAGSNPLVPGSADIDSRLDLQAIEGFNSISFSGTLRGDPFPSAEVFVVDTQGNSILLTSFVSPFEAMTGPYVGLPGQGDLRLGSFDITVGKGEGGLCRR